MLLTHQPELPEAVRRVTSAARRHKEIQTDTAFALLESGSLSAELPTHTYTSGVTRIVDDWIVKKQTTANRTKETNTSDDGSLGSAKSSTFVASRANLTPWEGLWGAEVPSRAQKSTFVASHANLARGEDLWGTAVPSRAQDSNSSFVERNALLPCEKGEPVRTQDFCPEVWLDQVEPTGQWVGQGAFSDVFIVKSKCRGLALHENVDLAFKREKTSGNIRDKEIENLKKFNHKYLVKFYAEGTVSGRKVIMLEAVNGGELKRDNFRELHPKKKAKRILQMLVAVEELHRQRLIHSDLKPEQFLYDLTSDTVKLGDFGLMCCTGLQARSLAGTPIFMDPDSFLTGKRTKQVDMWSMGLTIHFLTKNEQFPQWFKNPESFRSRDELEAYVKHIKSTYDRKKTLVEGSTPADKDLDLLITGCLLDKNQGRFTARDAIGAAIAYAQSTGWDRSEINNIVSPGQPETVLPPQCNFKSEAPPTKQGPPVTVAETSSGVVKRGATGSEFEHVFENATKSYWQAVKGSTRFMKRRYQFEYHDTHQGYPAWHITVFKKTWFKWKPKGSGELYLPGPNTKGPASAKVLYYRNAKRGSKWYYYDVTVHLSNEKDKIIVIEKMDTDDMDAYDPWIHRKAEAEGLVTKETVFEKVTK